MRLTILLTVLLLAACARNPDGDEESMRIRDTATTRADTLNPDDSLDRARRSVPDTAGDLDTTSRR